MLRYPTVAVITKSVPLPLPYLFDRLLRIIFLYLNDPGVLFYKHDFKGTKRVPFFIQNSTPLAKSILNCYIRYFILGFFHTSLDTFHTFFSSILYLSQVKLSRRVYVKQSLVKLPNRSHRSMQPSL